VSSACAALLRGICGGLIEQSACGRRFGKGLEASCLAKSKRYVLWSFVSKNRMLKMHSDMNRNLSGVSDQPSLRELEILRALILSRKTTSAAASLGVSQPAVSRAIAALEERIGRALFSREGGRLVPNADAFALDEEARPIFAALERIKNWPDGVQRQGALKVAASPTLAQFLLPDILARFRVLEPDLAIHVEIGTNTAVVASVADRLADLGLADSPLHHPGVRAEALREANAHCLMPADHRLAQKATVLPTDLHAEPIIALARRFPSRVEVDRIFAGAGVEPRIVAEAATSAFVAELVRRGVGVALVNPFPLTLGNGLDGLVARPFEPAIRYVTMLLFPAAGSVAPAARRFADVLKTTQPEDGLTRAFR
jgi:DNA-binding transcriptional LysR family regulator